MEDVQNLRSELWPKMKEWTTAAVASILALCVLCLVACQPHVTELLPVGESPPATESPSLPFETIERAKFANTGQYYEGQDPKLVVISEEQESHSLGDVISTEAQAQLQSLDFDQYFAAVAFKGIVGCVYPGIMIQRIGVEGNVITFYAHVLEPIGGVCKTMITSPYHVVKVRRQEMQGEIEFILNVDGTMVSRETHSLP